MEIKTIKEKELGEVRHSLHKEKEKHYDLHRKANDLTEEIHSIIN